MRLKRFPEHERAELDFTNQNTWKSAINGATRVFLMRPPHLVDMDHTLIPFIDYAFSAGCKHIVFLSVEGADKMEWVPHRKVERHLQSIGDNHTIFRPGFFSQNLRDAYWKDYRGAALTGTGNPPYKRACSSFSILGFEKGILLA